MSIPVSAYIKTIQGLVLTGVVLGIVSLALTTGAFATGGGEGGGGGGADSGGGNDDAGANVRRRKNVLGKRRIRGRGGYRRVYKYKKKRRRVRKKRRTRTISKAWRPPAPRRPAWTPPPVIRPPETASRGERSVFDPPDNLPRVSVDRPPPVMDAPPPWVTSAPTTRATGNRTQPGNARAPPSSGEEFPGEPPVPAIEDLEGELPAPVIEDLEGELPPPVIEDLEGELPPPVIEDLEGELPPPTNETAAPPTSPPAVNTEPSIPVERNPVRRAGQIIRERIINGVPGPLTGVAEAIIDSSVEYGGNVLDGTPGALQSLGRVLANQDRVVLAVFGIFDGSADAVRSLSRVAARFPNGARNLGRVGILASVASLVPSTIDLLQSRNAEEFNANSNALARNVAGVAGSIAGAALVTTAVVASITATVGFTASVAIVPAVGFAASWLGAHAAQALYDGTKATAKGMGRMYASFYTSDAQIKSESIMTDGIGYYSP